MDKNSSNFASEQLEASADDALRLAVAAGAGATALIDAWVQRGNAAAVAALAELGEGSARKAARRGLNVLRARGVPVPSVARPGRPPLAASAEAARQAWLLPPDPTGTAGLILAERQPSGSFNAAFVFFKDTGSLLRVQSGSLALSKIKENMRQALGGAGYGPVSVPWPWAQHRIAARRAWHLAQGVPEPLGMTQVQKLLEGAPASAPVHPFDEEGLALGDEDAERLARESAAMHNWPEFRAWLPPERAVQELLMSVGRRLPSEPNVPQEVLEPILREQVAAATDRYFTPERRALLAERMKDSGLSVLARLGEQAALQVAAVIHVIRGAGLITNPPSDVRFLTGYFDKALALIAAQQGGQLRIPIPARPSDASAAAGAEAPAAAGAEAAASGGAPAEHEPAAESPEPPAQPDAPSAGDP